VLFRSVIVATVGLVRSTVELLYPDPGYYTEPAKVDGEGLSEEEIEKQREYQEASSRRYAVLGLVGNAAMLLVAGPLYVYHWRKIEVEHVDRSESEPAGV